MKPASLSSDKTEFGIYLHWPFCQSKCPYCDFNSHVRLKGVDQERFIQAFLREMDYWLLHTKDKIVTSVFLGGGTPSLMEVASVDTLLSGIAERWRLADDIEITLEANPTSVEAKRFEGYRASGVNRLSLGVQALNDEDLQGLGRLHSASQAMEAIELARAIFPRLSFDLIYARPGQGLKEWESELVQAIDLAADHLSLYQLTIEEGTPFFDLYHKGKLSIPVPEQAAEFYDLTQQITTTRGLPAYEISNHAKPGAESRHNLTYWRYRPYLGIGPGAHGRVFIDGNCHAMAAIRHPESWLSQIEAEGHGIESLEALSFEQCGDEYLLMGLRLAEGIDAKRFEEISGRRLDEHQIETLRAHGMIEMLSSSRLRASPAGMLVLDAVVADLAA